jgi:hypothetical protein
VDGRRYVVKVLGGGAEFDEGRSGKKLLRIRITAEVDGVRREYTITYSRLGRDKAAVGRAYAKADAPGGQGGRRREVLGADQGPYRERA